MTALAVTVQANATLAQAARTMAHAKVKRLPVVDAMGLLEGVVSRGDLLKVFLRGDEDIAEEVRREVVSYLFRAPSVPVRVQVQDRGRHPHLGASGTPRWCPWPRAWCGPSKVWWTSSSNSTGPSGQQER